jgi:nucleoside-diphosphate-sugar epimerase
VRDTAKLHVVALINPDVQNERVFAFAETYTRHQFFTIIKEARPNAKLEVVPESNDRDLSEVAERPRALALLDWFGKDSFTPLKESIVDTIDAFDNSS